MDTRPLELDRIGTLVGGAGRREAWVAFVGALHQAARPGGALDGWAFHGTSLARARSAMRRGLSPSHAVANSPGAPDAWEETEATHWGTPAVAAFFAEDLIEGNGGRPTMGLAIVAARIDELATLGDMAADGQMLDCPLLSRLELTEEALMAEWEASDKGWAASWRSFGTLVVVGPGVAPGHMTLLRDAADVARLVDAVEAAAPAPR